MCPRQPFWMNLAIYITGAMMIVCALLFRDSELPALARAGLGALTVVPMTAWVFGFSRWLKSIDELERLIQLQAMGVALGSSVLLVLAYGLLTQARLLSGDAQSSFWAMLWAWMVGSWSASQAVIRRRYQ